jgi:hypothetical protein
VPAPAWSTPALREKGRASVRETRQRSRLRRRTIARMEFGSPAPFVAFLLAMVGGVLLAAGRYVGGAVAALLGVVVYGLWRFARERGDDDRHTLW